MVGYAVTSVTFQPRETAISGARFGTLLALADSTAVWKMRFKAIAVATSRYAPTRLARSR